MLWNHMHTNKFSSGTQTFSINNAYLLQTMKRQSAKSMLIYFHKVARPNEFAILQMIRPNNLQDTIQGHRRSQDQEQDHIKPYRTTKGHTRPQKATHGNCNTIICHSLQTFFVQYGTFLLMFPPRQQQEQQQQSFFQDL